MWRIALKTLVADRGKLLTAVVGVVFSVLLVNLQGGLFLGLIRKAGLLVDYGEADIWVGHRQMHDIENSHDIPRRWVNRVRPISGVVRAEPHLIGFGKMKMPSGGFEGVAVVGVEPASRLGGAWNLVEGPRDALRHPDGIVVDTCEDYKLESPELGDIREINGKRARIIAKTHGILGFLVTPYVFTSYERAADYLNRSPGQCSYILVEVANDADPTVVCAEIRKRIPEVDALTSDQYSQRVVNFWMTHTGLGISFGAATLIGVMVGLVMVAETLYAMVLDRLAEFGTLKAIGATPHQIQTILLSQALIMALTGSVIGLTLATVVQHFNNTPQTPILIPWWLATGSCVLVLVICLVSAILPYLRIRKVDPLMVIQS